jgi:sugar phosphate isomerase/epimerase
MSVTAGLPWWRTAAGKFEFRRESQPAGRGRFRGMSGPKIYLAIDNCFAVKRWTQPLEWARIVKDLGLEFVEASTDNECDPLYVDPEYLYDWVQAVQTAQSQTGVRVVNLYSGHGTYSLLGIASPDGRNRKRLVEGWLKVIIRTASQLQAGLGFFCHAFNQRTLQHPDSFRAAEEALFSLLMEFALYADECGARTAAIEQMYSPHQIPWTIQGSRRLLREVWGRSRKPFYITIDTGHQTGQGKFKRPPHHKIVEILRAGRMGDHNLEGKWLGPDSVYKLLESAISSPLGRQDSYIQRIEAEMERYAYLFAESEDADLYAWLSQLACYSPIIHLQQTNGDSSSHLPFTQETNEHGIVLADKVLNAISASFAQAPESGMPPRCQEIFLTLEIFPEATAFPMDIISCLKQSVAYWRRFIPCDGLNLDEIHMPRA